MRLPNVQLLPSNKSRPRFFSHVDTPDPLDPPIFWGLALVDLSNSKGPFRFLFSTSARPSQASGCLSRPRHIISPVGVCGTYLGRGDDKGLDVTREGINEAPGAAAPSHAGLCNCGALFNFSNKGKVSAFISYTARKYPDIDMENNT